MLFIVGQLPDPPAPGFIETGLHGAGHAVAVHQHPAVDIAGGTAAGLDQRTLRAEKTLLVGIKNGNQGNLRQIQPFPQQVDPDQHIEFSQAQVANNLHPLNGNDVGMEIFYPHPQLTVIVGQLLGHAFGQGRHQHPFATGHGFADFVEQVVNLAEIPLLQLPPLQGGEDLKLPPPAKEGFRGSAAFPPSPAAPQSPDQPARSGG